MESHLDINGIHDHHFLLLMNHHRKMYPLIIGTNIFHSVVNEDASNAYKNIVSLMKKLFDNDPFYLIVLSLIKI